jgi:mono/diheme cytochrome c family protein
MFRGEVVGRASHSACHPEPQRGICAGASIAHPPRFLALFGARNDTTFVRRVAFCLLTSAFLIVGCRQEMSYQPRYDPLEPSDFFANGMSARPRIAGTVARGELVSNPFLETGKIGAADGDGFPFPVTAAVIDRGQERFNIYCSECHGRVGDGNGMIPSRGFKHPPSYHEEKLKKAPVGHFFDVVTNGFGAMPSYASRVAVDDRWRIAAYIRALQLSQSATPADVPPGQTLEPPGSTPAPAARTEEIPNR